LIPEIEKFLSVAIFKMVVTIIVAAILKMVTGRNFSMSGINSGHHNLPTYEMALKSDNVEFVRYCGGHFENGDFCGKNGVLPWSWGKIEKSFSPKLTDYFIQGVRK
jgi:hypothetical protein